MTIKQCFQCRNGEHENYDDDVRLFVISDPDKQERTKRGYLCGQHQMMAMEDGWNIKRSW